MPLDLAKLSRVLGLLGSAHDGECLAAARQAQRMIRDNGMQWADFILAAEQRDRAEQRAADVYDAAVVLERERDAALAQAARLRSANGAANGFATAMWHNAGTGAGASPTVGSGSRHAQWVLDLYGQGLIHLSEKELPFVNRCAQWHGELTDRMKPWLGDIVGRVSRHTGQQPPP
jgi:hypothetical protein